MRTLADMLDVESCADRQARSAEILTDELMGGDLPAHLDLDECRELIGALMAQLFSQPREFCRTPAEHVQTCCVFARAEIERAVKRVVERFTEAA